MDDRFRIQAALPPAPPPAFDNLPVEPPLAPADLDTSSPLEAGMYSSRTQRRGARRRVGMLLLAVSVVVWGLVLSEVRHDPSHSALVVAIGTPLPPSVAAMKPTPSTPPAEQARVVPVRLATPSPVPSPTVTPKAPTIVALPTVSPSPAPSPQSSGAPTPVSAPVPRGAGSGSGSPAPPQSPATPPPAPPSPRA